MKFLAFFILLFILGESLFAKPIKISALSQLDFGTGAPGDSAKQILPGTTETAANGSFAVTGDANRAFSILLPASATMEIGNGQNKDSIAISSFTSFPSVAGVLNGAGDRTVFVGATRAALKLTQRAGLYSGSYSITVVY